MRAYGITNAAPYASAPAVGAAGDTYWNTTTKVLYVSDGTAWNVADTWTVSGATLTPNDTSKAVSIVGGAAGATEILGSAVVKGRLQQQVQAGAGVGCGLFLNRDWLNANAQDDAAKPSWAAQVNISSDSFFVQRSPAGSTTQTNVLVIDAALNMTLAGSVAVKASGTTWANPSDRRLKDDIEDYPTGLAAIVQLQPRTFVYNGKGGSTAGMRGYGFVADEIAPVMPETVGVRPGKLDAADEDETDIQTLDQSNLILALVNAVKELASRVAALEASLHA
jgi:Chaperone of endosialidase